MSHVQAGRLPIIPPMNKLLGSNLLALTLLSRAAFAGTPTSARTMPAATA